MSVESDGRRNENMKKLKVENNLSKTVSETGGTSTTNTIEEKLNHMKRAIDTISKKYLKAKNTKKKSRMTKEILQMMEERRIQKTVNQIKYREFQEELEEKVEKLRKYGLSKNVKR